MTFTQFQQKTRDIQKAVAQAERFRGSGYRSPDAVDYLIPALTALNDMAADLKLQLDTLQARIAPFLPPENPKE